jgi:hypothetical protein
VVGLWAGVLVLSGLGPPALEVAQTVATFGEVYEGAVVSHRFPFRNTGGRALRISGLRAASSLGGVSAHPEVVPPGREGYVEVRQPTWGRLGLATFRFMVKADDGAPERRLALHGFVQSAYDPDQPLVDLGTVAPGAAATLELSSREVERLEVQGVADAPPFLVAEAGGRSGRADEGVALRLRVRPDAPLGYHTGVLRLRTNVEVQPEVRVAWRANVFEDVAPGESPLDLGVVREGQPFTKVVRLERRSGAPLEIERVEAGGGVTVAVEPCPDPSAACRALRLRGVAPPAGRPLGGTVSVTAAGARPLALAYSGIVVGAETVVNPIGEVGTPPEPAPAAGPPSATPAPVVGVPGERRVRITWEARREQQTYGYLVYRATQRDGPFRRVTPHVVRASDGAGPHAYTYVDEDVAAGRTYYYYVESVGKSGRKARFSGVVAKLIPAGPP